MAITRSFAMLSKFSSIFLRFSSVLKFSGIVNTRSSSSGGSFIQASVRVWRP